MLYQKEKVYFRRSAKYLEQCRFGSARLSKESGVLASASLFTDVTNVCYSLLHGNGTIVALKRDKEGGLGRLVAYIPIVPVVPLQEGSRITFLVASAMHGARLALRTAAIQNGASDPGTFCSHSFRSRIGCFHVSSRVQQNILRKSALLHPLEP